MSAVLDNVMWNAPSGPHVRQSAGTATARRHAKGFSPIAGFPDPRRPDFHALSPYCEIGERFYCDGGPFGPRTMELGACFGCFEGDRLVALAGERMHAGSFREVSGVCTHPDFQRRGLARRLMMKLVRQQLQRNEMPFLRVMRENQGARALCERTGFRNYAETVVRVVSPTAG